MAIYSASDKKQVGYLERISKGLDNFPSAHVDRFITDLIRLRLDHKTLWVAGNGGSFATAIHLAADLVNGVSPPVKAIALGSNAATLTATANDLSYTEIFSRELRNQAASGDSVLMISASGNSGNLLSLCDEANRLGLATYAFLGFDGGELGKKADVPILFPTAVGDYGVAEDMHSMACHFIKERLTKVM